MLGRALLGSSVIVSSIIHVVIVVVLRIKLCALSMICSWNLSLSSPFLGISLDLLVRASVLVLAPPEQYIILKLNLDRNSDQWA